MPKHTRRALPALEGMSGGALDAIIVLGGSFCPIHAGHISALDAGRRHAAQKLGLNVVGGYLACAHDSHVFTKLGDEAAIESAARLRMCNACTGVQANSWLRPSPRTFGSAYECADNMITANHLPETRIIIVRGADRAKNKKSKDHRVIFVDVSRNLSGGKPCGKPTAAKTEQLSSTLIRREIQVKGFSAIAHLVQIGALPATVAPLLRTHYMGGSLKEDEAIADVELEENRDTNAHSPLRL